jgi:hypothetical protein
VDASLIDPQNSFYILGTVVVSWVTFGCSYLIGSWQWRTPYVIQIPFAVAILIATLFVPETPRFHIGKNQKHLALEFFARYHGNGNIEDELVQFEFREVCESIEKEREAKAEKWSAILRHPSSRHRLGLAALMTFLTNASGWTTSHLLSLTIADVWVVSDLFLLSETQQQSGLLLTARLDRVRITRDRKRVCPDWHRRRTQHVHLWLPDCRCLDRNQSR